MYAWLNQFESRDLQIQARKYEMGCFTQKTLLAVCKSLRIGNVLVPLTGARIEINKRINARIGN